MSTKLGKLLSHYAVNGEIHFDGNILLSDTNFLIFCEFNAKANNAHNSIAHNSYPREQNTKLFLWPFVFLRRRQKVSCDMKCENSAFTAGIATAQRGCLRLKVIFSQ